MPQQGPFLTVKEVASLLKVSTKTVYRWLGRGALHGRKIGGGWRIPLADLENFLARGNVSAA